MGELVVYLTEDPQVEVGKPQVVKMPGHTTPHDSSRYSHASTAERSHGSPYVANASAVRGQDMAFTTKAEDRTAAQVSSCCRTGAFFDGSTHSS